MASSTVILFVCIAVVFGKSNHHYSVSLLIEHVSGGVSSCDYCLIHCCPTFVRIWTTLFALRWQATTSCILVNVKL